MQTTATLDQIIKEFEAECDVQPQSKSCYVSVLKSFYRWMNLKGYPSRYPKLENLLLYKHELSIKGTYQSANLYLSVLKKYFRWLESKKYYPNLMTGVKFFQRYKGYLRTPLTPEQSKMLLDSVDLESVTGARDYLIILILIVGGIRAIELTRIDYIDFYKKSDQLFFATQPKGSIRKNSYIEVTDLLPYIERYLKMVHLKSDDPFFVSFSRRNKGKRLSTRSIRQIVMDHLKKIGITDKTITTHSLRHTAANILIDNHFPIFDVQMHLGHTSPNTTAVYTVYSQNKSRFENKTGKFLFKTIMK